MAGRHTLSVSLKADRDYVHILGLLAKKKGKSIGELVREATDTTFGADIERLTSAIFFADNGNDCHQFTTENTTTQEGNN